MIKHNLNPYLILLFFIFVVIVYHIVGYAGHFGYDDMLYAEIASDFLKGDINYDDHFTYRFPVVLLTALSYNIFGISDFASSLPSLILTILTLFLIFWMVKKESISRITLVLSLTVFSPWFIFYSDKLMPDIYIVFSVVAAITCLHQYKFGNKNRHSAFYALLFVLALLFGFMAKGTIILSLPLWLYLFLVDVLKKRDQKFWGFTIGFGVGLFILYFLVIWMLTGDIFKRFEAIASNSYLNLCSYDQQPFRILLKRITVDFLSMLIHQSMAPAFIFILAAMVSKKTRSIFALNNTHSFFLSSAIILLLSSNFMTISLTTYSPMCIDPRHYLFLLPIASIPASAIIIKFFKDKNNFLPILTGLTITALASYFLHGNSFWLLYMPLTLLFGIYYFIPPIPLHQKIFLVFFVVILALKPFNAVLSARKINYPKQKSLFHEHVLKEEKNAIIVTNEVQKRLARYYNQFNDSSSIEFISYKNFNPESAQNEKIILFRNWYTRYLTNMEFKELPYYAQEVSPSNPLIYENKDLNLSIHNMIDFTKPELTTDTLLVSRNSFELPVAHWNQRKEDLTEEITHTGSHAIHVPEFSATFEYPMDSLGLDHANSLIIKTQLMCNFYNQTDTKLVISIENDEGVYYWTDLAINKHLKAYGNWWPVGFETEISTSELKENSLLKIFLWNTGDDTGYIDDFEVIITGLFFKQ